MLRTNVSVCSDSVQSCEYRKRKQKTVVCTSVRRRMSSEFRKEQIRASSSNKVLLLSRIFNVRRLHCIIYYDYNFRIILRIKSDNCIMEQFKERHSFRWRCDFVDCGVSHNVRVTVGIIVCPTAECSCHSHYIQCVETNNVHSSGPTQTRHVHMVEKSKSKET